MIVAAAAVIVILFVVRFARSVRRDPEGAAAVGGQIGRTGDDWRADATAAESSGRWREALRCRYRALLADLARGGLLEEVPGRTTGEYLARVRDDLPAAAPAFGDATAAFERAWYSAGDVTRRDLDAFRGHAAAVSAAVGLRRREPAVAGSAS